jgi:tight adherence protein B
MDYLLLIALVAAFLAVVLLFEGGFVYWNATRGPESRRIQRRLQAMSAGAPGVQQSIIVKQRLMSELPTLDRVMQQIPRLHQLDRLLLQSSVSLSVTEFLGISALLAAGVFMGSLLLGLYWPIALVLAAAAASLPLLYVLNAREKRLQTVEQQLPDALDLMSRALRAGHSFPSAVEMVGTEAPMPIAMEFRITFDEVNYGIPMQDALMNMATRVPSTDLRYFVIAVLIQRETGGNLAELLDNLSALMRARFKLLGQIRVLSAEGRLSAWILTLLPFALALVIYVIHPTMMKTLWEDPFGLKLVFGALMLIIFGIFWMWRIIKIRV